MVKHFVPLMTRFFTPERFGRPQFLAGTLLLAFFAQALWLVHSELNAPELTQAAPSRRAGPPGSRLASISRRQHRRRAVPRPSQPTFHRSRPRRERLRHPTLPVTLPCNRRSAASRAPKPAPSRILCVLAMAAAPSIPGLRASSRRISLVRSPPSLRQHRRLPRPYPLLFFPFYDPVQRRLAHRPRNSSRLGILRRNLHRHRRSPHALRPPRSSSLELASHRPAGNLASHRRRIPVLHDRRRARGPGLPALSGTHPTRRSPQHLDRRLRRGASPTLCRLFLSSPHILRGNATRLLLGSNLAQLHRPSRLPPGSCERSCEPVPPWPCCSP